MGESGIVEDEYLGVGNFEFSSLAEVPTVDAACRAREHAQTVNPLKGLAEVTRDLRDGGSSAPRRADDSSLRDRRSSSGGFKNPLEFRAQPHTNRVSLPVGGFGDSRLDGVDHAR